MPSSKAIERQNQYLIKLQQDFRIAADYIAAALAEHPAVRKVVLFGSVAVPLWKEVPRFREYRRAGVELWHECRDVDLAVWADDLDCLPALRKLRVGSLRDLNETKGLGIADHQVEIFLFDRESADYLGRLCYFNHCPRGNRDCNAPGCGDTPFLKKLPGFRLNNDALDPKKTVILYPFEPD